MRSRSLPEHDAKSEILRRCPSDAFIDAMLKVYDSLSGPIAVGAVTSGSLRLAGCLPSDGIGRRRNRISIAEVVGRFDAEVILERIEARNTRWDVEL